LVTADILAKNQVIQSFATVSAKAGFLLSEKIYQRIADSLEELWLLRASEAVLFFVEADVLKNQQLRSDETNTRINIRKLKFFAEHSLA
jgi:hypothetical protein